MYKKEPQKPAEPFVHQVRHLQELINEVQRCCEDKRFYESRKFGIPFTELKTLLLFGDERYLTVKGIAQRLDVAKSRVTILVNSMLDKGLIDRTDDPRDARIKLLSLTAEGRRIVSMLDAFHREIHSEILRQLEPDRKSVV